MSQSMQRAKERARVPAALVIMVLGIILTLAMHSGVLHGIGIGPVKPRVIVPTKAEWRKGKSWTEADTTHSCPKS